MKNRFTIRKIICTIIGIMSLNVISPLYANDHSQESTQDDRYIHLDEMPRSDMIDVNISDQTTNQYLQKPPQSLRGTLNFSGTVLDRTKELSQIISYFKASEFSAETMEQYNKIYPPLIAECLEEGLKVRFSPYFKGNHGRNSLNQLAILNGSTLTTTNRSYIFDLYNSFLRDRYCFGGLITATVAGGIVGEILLGLKANSDFNSSDSQYDGQYCYVCTSGNVTVGPDNQITNGSLANSTLISGLQNCMTSGNDITQSVTDFIQNNAIISNQWACTALDSYTYLLGMLTPLNGTQNATNMVQSAGVYCESAVTNATSQCLDIIQNSFYIDTQSLEPTSYDGWAYGEADAYTFAAFVWTPFYIAGMVVIYMILMMPAFS